MQTVNNENDELKSKETYCNMWVLQHPNEVISTAGTNNYRSSVNLATNQSSSTNLSVTEALSKSASIYNMNKLQLGGDTNAQKSEEQLQREYLVNLLLQLQHEQNDDNLKRV